jgi:predicted Zn-dependent protease with MMP-like domain
MPFIASGSARVGRIFIFPAGLESLAARSIRVYFGRMVFEKLIVWAEEEVQAVLKILPPEVQTAAKNCTVTFERRPGGQPQDTDLEGDELGLFDGSSMLDDPSPDALPQIRLFLMNLWEWVNRDEQDFRDEVGTTFLHELGHYLGWDEEEVGIRGLE